MIALSFLFPPIQIDNLLKFSKIPIVVGGTNYYIESLLWHNLVSPGIGKRKRCDYDGDSLSGLTQELSDFISAPSMEEKMEEMESTKLYEFLQQIDPLMANRLHPNNKRKIMRWVLTETFVFIFNFQRVPWKTCKMVFELNSIYRCQQSLWTHIGSVVAKTRQAFVKRWHRWKRRIRHGAFKDWACDSTTVQKTQAYAGGF